MALIVDFAYLDMGGREMITECSALHRLYPPSTSQHADQAQKGLETAPNPPRSRWR